MMIKQTIIFRTWQYLLVDTPSMLHALVSLVYAPSVIRAATLEYFLVTRLHTTTERPEILGIKTS